MYHRNLRDSVPTHHKLLRPHKQWLVAANNREEALREKNSTLLNRYNTFTKKLTPLPVQTKVLIQDYTDKKRWNKTGVVVERNGRSYTIRMDGSGRIVSRNRRFLKAMVTSASDSFSWNPQSFDHSTHTDSTSDRSPSYTANTQHNAANTQYNSIDTHHNAVDMSTQNFDARYTESSPVSTSRVTSLPDSTTSSPGQGDRDTHIPHMLRELMPHNNPGLKE